MNWKTIFSVMSLLLLSEIVIATDGKIDRKALVSRHNIIQTKVDKIISFVCWEWTLLLYYGYNKYANVSGII